MKKIYSVCFGILMLVGLSASRVSAECLEYDQNGNCLYSDSAPAATTATTPAANTSAAAATTQTTTQETSNSTTQEKFVTLTNPLKGVNSLSDLFYKIVDFIMSLSYVVIALFLILSGFKFVRAQGNPEELEDAKRTFKYTIIGALLLIGANTIIQVVQGIIKNLQS